jgi:hypothetical protein
MGIFSNLFGSSNQSQVSSINADSLQILMKQVKKNSIWFELHKTTKSTIYIDKASCYADENDSIFFVWRDVYPNKGDVYYFSLFIYNEDESQDFHVLKQINQITKGSEQYSFKEDRYSISAEDDTVQKIIECVYEFAYENNYREVPEYIDGLA